MHKVAHEKQKMQSKSKSLKSFFDFVLLLLKILQKLYSKFMCYLDIIFVIAVFILLATFFAAVSLSRSCLLGLPLFHQYITNVHK